VDVGVVVDDEARFFVICDHALLKDLSTEDLDPNQAHMKFAASFAPHQTKIVSNECPVTCNCAILKATQKTMTKVSVIAIAFRRFLLFYVNTSSESVQWLDAIGVINVAMIHLI
jgi:hypothetical protein